MTLKTTLPYLTLIPLYDPSQVTLSMSTSTTDDTLDIVQTVSPTSRVLELVKEAAQGIRAEAERAQTKPLSKMVWTSHCEEVTKQYFGDHYQKVCIFSPD